METRKLRVMCLMDRRGARVTCLMDRREARVTCLLLVILSLFINPAVTQGTAGEGDCDVDNGADPDDFTCTNTLVIPCSQVDDGRNDCGDNSDEGYLYDCNSGVIGGVLTYQFKCTRDDLADYSAVSCTVFNDNGVADCPDRSDEQKYLGDDCDGTAEDLDSDIGCWYFMPESYCNASNQCDCPSGFLEINRNSDCELRERGHACETQLDCTDAAIGLYCNASSICDCDAGYYVDDMDSGACIANLLYENCTDDLDCSNPIPNAECDADGGVCVCNDQYIANHTSNFSCTARVLGDSCRSDAQCQQAMSAHTVCMMDECVCRTGADPNDDDTDCIKRLVGDNCTDDSNCALIHYAECKNSGECDCVSNSMLVDHTSGACALGIGDLYCESNDNCTAQIDDSYCATGSSVCMCLYGYYAETHTKCSRRILGTHNCRNNTDCSAAVDNAVCRDDGSCQCAAGYGPDPDTTSGKKCVSEDQLQCLTFACLYPWAVALLVVGLLAIAAVIVVLIIKKPWRKPGEKAGGANVQPHTVAPVSNGGPIDPESAKPLWTLRPKSGIPTMYGNDVRMQEARDPETDAFYNGGKTKTMTPVDGDVFIFKGETGELQTAELATRSSDDGFHRCDYLLPDGTKCEFRNVQPLDNIQEEPGTAWVSEDDDATLAALSETGLRTSSEVPYPQTTIQSFSNGTNRHIALAFASMEEPMETGDNSQLFSEDDFDMRGHNDSRQGVFSDGVASVTGVELNNSAINEVARANSTIDMAKVEEEDEDEDEDGGKKVKKGKKGKKGKDGKGKKDKKGKKGDKKEKKGKKEKGEKKEKKGKKKDKGKKNKNNNNRNCDGNSDLLDSTLESVCEIFTAAENESNQGASACAPAQSASRAPAHPSPQHLHSSHAHSPQLVGGYDDMDAIDPMAFSRAHEQRRGVEPVHRPESRCSMRSPVDTVVLPVPGYIRDNRETHTLYDMPRRNGPMW